VPSTSETHQRKTEATQVEVALEEELV